MDKGFELLENPSMNHVITITALVCLICGCSPSEPLKESLKVPPSDQKTPEQPTDSQGTNIALNPELEVKHVNGEEAAKMVKDDPEVIVLDIRTQEEFQSGHIADARNIDYRASDFEEKLRQLDRHKTYLVH